MSRALVKRPTTLPANFAQGSQRIARIKDLISEAAENDARLALEAADASADENEIEDAVIVTVDLAAQDTDAVPLVRARRATAAYKTTGDIPVIRDIITVA